MTHDCWSDCLFCKVDAQWVPGVDDASRLPRSEDPKTQNTLGYLQSTNETRFTLRVNQSVPANVSQIPKLILIGLGFFSRVPLSLAARCITM